MRKLSPKGVTLAATLSVAYFVLWGCMPLASVAPPLPGVSDGMAVTGGSTLEFREMNQGAIKPFLFPAAGVQYWSRKEGRIDRGLAVFFGYPMIADGSFLPYLGAGGFLEFPVAEKTWGQISVQASGGLAWARIGLPVSWETKKGRHLYTHPSWTAGTELYTHIPIGWTRERNKGGQSFHEIGTLIALDNLDQNPGILTYTYGWAL